MKLLILLILSIYFVVKASATPTPGINYSYYEGTWSSLPDFNSLTPVKKGVVNYFNLDARNKEKNYAFLWQGYITIPASGTYTFETLSDDGSKLYIGNYAYNTPSLVNNDGLHGRQSRSGSINLNAGVYPIAITYFQNDGNQTWEVYWSSNTGITKQKIPDHVFSTGSPGPDPLPDPEDDNTPGTGGMTGITNYYFSTSNGDDSRSSTQAQNPATPWKTLNKLSSFFPNLNAGDAVLFNRGETFDGSINIAKSGSSGLPIIFSSYGYGIKPVITGLTTLSNWVSVGNGVWESNCPSPNTVNMVVFNGVVKAMGRYPNITAPNKGFLTLESYNGNRQITDHQLSGSPNWTGAEVVIRKNNWTLDRGLITNHSGNTISYNSPTAHEPTNGYGYFFQNSPLTLDQAGEWYFNPSTQKMRMYNGSTNPISGNVKASIRDVLVSIDNKSNITFDNIAFQGGDVNALKLQSSQNIRIQNCVINFSGTQGISGVNSSNIVMETNTFNNTSNDAIEFYNSSYSTVKNNLIKNTGLLPGMGLSNNQQYEAIFMEGANNLIETNQVLNTGYSAITFAGEGAVVKNNFINYFCLTLDDGGGIYGWGEMDKYNRKLIGNIILNGIGAYEGTIYPFSTSASGILIDDRTAYIEMLNNTIANCSRNGIYLHNSRDMSVKGNTLFNNTIQLGLVHDKIAPDVPIRNITVTDNILFSKTEIQFILETGSLTNDIANFGSMDNNIYARPVDENGIITSNYKDPNDNNVFSFFNLDEWKNQYGFDRNSRKSPVKVPSYLINGVIGGNKFANGSFNSNTNGASCQSAPGRCTVSWNSGGKLDGGALQVSFDPLGGATNEVGTYLTFGGVQAGKHYRIKFSVLGANGGKTLKGFLLQAGGSYSRLSETRFFELTNTRTEHEFLFSPTTNESGVIIAFEIKGLDIPFWMDNFQVHEVDATITNLDDYIRLEYNSTNSNKNIPLNGTYSDVKNNTYYGNINLAPYTSAVLIKQTSQAQSVNFLTNTANQEVDITASEALNIKVSPNPVSNKLQIFVNAPKGNQKSILSIQSVSGATIKTIPLTSANKTITVDVASWSNGVYLINLISDGHIINKKFVKQ